MRQGSCLTSTCTPLSRTSSTSAHACLLPWTASPKTLRRAAPTVLWLPCSAHYKPESDGEYRWRIAQGVEMKRPSVLDARTEKRSGTVTGVWIAGNCTMVSEGYIEV